MAKTIQIPLEDLPSALRYPRTYLRNKFNLRIGAIDSFFEPNTFRQCFYPPSHPKFRNPLNQLSLQFDGELDWRLDKRPRFWHFDLGLKEDPAAIVCVHIDSIDNLPLLDENIKAEELSAHVAVDFYLEADPEKWPNKEVIIRDLRQLIWWCQRRGMVFGLITFDGWQSSDSLQTITRQGLKADRLSIDSTMTKVVVDRASNTLKRVSTGNAGAAMECLWLLAREKRLHTPYFPQLVEESKWQQQDERTKKVVKMPGTSDNIIQATAGACYNAIVNLHLSWYVLRQWGKMSSQQKLKDVKEMKRRDYYYNTNYATEFGNQERDDTPVKGGEGYASDDPMNEYF